MEESITEIQYPFLLQESSPNAPKILKEMELLFNNLKKNKNDHNNREKLISKIKDFTKIEKVVFILEKGFNAGVFTLYKPTAASSFSQIISYALESKDFNEKPMKQLSSLKEVKEPANAIDTIYIFYGQDMVKALTGAELVAVLLHELGHTFMTTTNLPYKLLSTFKRLFAGTIYLNFLAKIFDFIAFKFYLLYNLIALGFIWGITFDKRRNEYAADKFVLKYGYADDLISVLAKFKKPTRTPSGWLDKVKEFINQIYTILTTIINPSDHPSLDRRIKQLENKIFNEYRKQYPEYKTTIDMIQTDYDELYKEVGSIAE